MKGVIIIFSLLYLRFFYLSAYTDSQLISIFKIKNKIILKGL